MRARLLVANILDDVLHALNIKTQSRLVKEDDDHRIEMIGSDQEIHEQTLRARAFAEEIAGKL